MSEQTVKARKKRRRKVILTLCLLVLIGAALWIFVAPGLKAGATTVYDSYTASTGSISNSMSFSGSISVVNYETLSPGADGTIRQLYVAEEQKVKQGDKLARLSTGETLKANFDGQVNAIGAGVGDSVSTSTGVIQIVDFDNLSVSIRVDEYAIANIYVGQACRVTVTALNVTFDSVVSHINRIPSNSGNTSYYTVTAEFSVTENVLPGMQVTVVIPQEEANDAVILNKSALSMGQDNSAYVLMRNAAGEMERVAVAIGVDNDNYVQITSGLSAGDTVYAVAKTSAAASGGLASLFSALGGGQQPAAMPSGDVPSGFPGGNMDRENMGGSMGGGRP